ncbi:Kv channel-interacting protein 2-like isoform X3 [Portunus trituberculatus]|uniref:Kv channel-interacting protein 2-like isoform X3 n=1 Tax=Portunus trituberculatus TaxID=210409 RepID=UPI001E1D048A|nr:Kv channel-interacting protein 2-like isoform X3 [Portunus trituberculatus]
MWWKDGLYATNYDIISHSNESSESSTSTHQLLTLVSTSSESSDASTQAHTDTSLMQGRSERSRSSSPPMNGRRASFAAALNNSILRRRGTGRRKPSIRHKESFFVSVWRRCLPCTATSGYSGIPLLVRQRSRGGAAGGSMSGPARGRRSSVAGGPRRQLSRRTSRRESRRGNKNRRRSSVHPPVHLPSKEGEAGEEAKEKQKVPPMRRLSRMLSNAGPALVRRVSKLRRKSLAHQEYEDFELTPLRYRPEGLDQLSEATRFSKEELQFMYRGFKQECPTGVISEETFKEIYGKFFPLGGQPEDGTGRNSAMYAHYVFGTMDHDGSGTITFGDFIMGLSVLLKGTLQERINWIFNLYDINNDGYITKEELVDIVTSIYDLMGEQTSPAIDDGTPVDHVERIFEKLDLNKDGVVTMDEFMEYCSKQPHDPHERDSLHIHFIPWLNSLTLQGKAQRHTGTTTTTTTTTTTITITTTTRF